MHPEQLVRDLYLAAEDGSFIERFCNEFVRPLGGDAIQVTLYDAQNQMLASHASTGFEQPHQDFPQYVGVDPRLPAAIQNKNLLMSCVDLAPVEVMEKSVMVNEYLDKPHVDLRWAYASYFEVATGINSAMAVMRGRKRGAFGIGEHEPMADAFPHIKHLIRTSYLLTQSGLWRSSVSAVLDHSSDIALLVTADRSIVYANHAANAELTRGSHIQSRQGKLCIRLSPGNAEFIKFLSTHANVHTAQVPPGDSLLLRDEDGAPCAVLRVRAMPIRAWINANRQQLLQINVEVLDRAIRLPREVASLLGLTPRELTLAEALCSRDSLDVVAGRLSITIETARGYLKSLMAKLGVRQQKQVVHMLTRLARLYGG